MYRCWSIKYFLHLLVGCLMRTDITGQSNMSNLSPWHSLPISDKAGGEAWFSWQKKSSNWPIRDWHAMYRCENNAQSFFNEATWCLTFDWLCSKWVPKSGLFLWMLSAMGLLGFLSLSSTYVSYWALPISLMLANCFHNIFTHQILCVQSKEIPSLFKKRIPHVFHCWHKWFYVLAECWLCTNLFMMTSCPIGCCTMKTIFKFTNKSPSIYATPVGLQLGQQLLHAFYMFIDLCMCLVNGHSREYVQIFLDNKITLLELVVYFRFFFICNISRMCTGSHRA